MAENGRALAITRAFGAWTVTREDLENQVLSCFLYYALSNSFCFLRFLPLSATVLPKYINHVIRTLLDSDTVIGKDDDIAIIERVFD